MPASQASRTTGTLPAGTQETRTAGTISSSFSLGSDILGHNQNTIGAPADPETLTPLHFVFGISLLTNFKERRLTQSGDITQTQESRTTGTA